VKVLTLILGATLGVLAHPPLWAESPQTLRLWEGPAPGVRADAGEEVQEPQGRVSNVSVPTLDVYLPEPARANGAAIIICSGGGYVKLASGPLGKGAADIFVPQGFAVFSLKYRLRPVSADVFKDSLADAARAVQIVRSRAKEWNIRPDRIGMVGFSAGSNLILNLAGHNGPGNPASPDPIDRVSSRPDFIGLCCPWPGGRKLADFAITSAAPPAFIVHARDDDAARFSFAEEIAAAWQEAGVPVRFVPYETGKHMGFNFPNPRNADWTEKFVAWLNELKIL